MHHSSKEKAITASVNEFSNGSFREMLQLAGERNVSEFAAEIAGGRANAAKQLHHKGRGHM